MKIIWIRHGKTASNLQKRYIGRTDEPLCNEGRLELLHNSLSDLPQPEHIVASPMKRCVETAEILYPEIPLSFEDGLKECDFGDFEGKNYLELSENPDYQHFLQSFGKAPFPNGESQQAFKTRCVRAFLKAVSEHEICETLSFIVHGGTIMAVLEALCVPKREYYSFQVANGCGFLTKYYPKKKKLTLLSEIPMKAIPYK